MFFFVSKPTKDLYFVNNNLFFIFPLFDISLIDVDFSEIIYSQV